MLQRGDEWPIRATPGRRSKEALILLEKFRSKYGRFDLIIGDVESFGTPHLEADHEGACARRNVEAVATRVGKMSMNDATPRQPPKRDLCRKNITDFGPERRTAWSPGL